MSNIDHMLVIQQRFADDSMDHIMMRGFIDSLIKLCRTSASVGEFDAMASLSLDKFLSDTTQEELAPRRARGFSRLRKRVLEYATPVQRDLGVGCCARSISWT